MRSLVIAVALVTSGAALAQPAPGDRKQAGAHFKRGEAAQRAGRFRDAIAEYEEAYRLVPHPNALFNIAVCYEKLGEWSLSADYYERYLDEPGDHSDAAAVKDKVKDLRAKTAAPDPVPDRVPDPGPDPTPDPTPTERIDRTPPTTNPGIGIGRPIEPVTPPAPPAPARWHLGGSYGIGFGDAPVERYLAYGGMRFASRLELDAILGKFGKNDLAIGLAGKLMLGPRHGVVAPFARGGVTLGYAKQDASSSADTKLPLGLEAGGGILLGTRGRIEVAAVVRWITGGFDMTSTAVDSYINDSVAVAIDIGLTFDIPSSLASLRAR